MKTTLLSVCLLVFTLSANQIEGRFDYRERRKRPHRQYYECETCEQVVENFRKGLERTKKYTYADKNSETRLVEIYDQLCKDIHEQQECPRLLEEYEELIETFWYNDNFEKTAEAFHKFFCIDNVKACCPKGTFGQNCEDCTGGRNRPCRGNGRCDGSGMRAGNGLCICDTGYKGSLCENCDERHYEILRNETHTICKACHKSCKTTCTGDGPKDCYDCGDGWKFVRDKGCRDVNECLSKPCGEKEYCANKQGSYMCRACDPACDTCYGRGHTKCRNCSEGYLKNNTECLDIDECQSTGHEDLCIKRGEMCKNAPGSYVCVCQPGFVKDLSGACVPEKKEEPIQKPKKPKSDKKQVPKCSVCKEVVNNFKLGLERTKQKHYEGGNSQWEESRLGRYPDSELRLVEATDELCFKASKECPQVLEDYEELIEEFWFKSGLKKDADVFYQYFCIDNVKACCPNNTFGPNCTECTGGVERPCKGNGVCDGEGTREGTGKCNCSLGYEGELCDSCTTGYYQTHKNDTHTECTACHESCKDCSGAGPKACWECSEGWFHTDDKGCQACHESCQNCTGEDPKACGACKEGWFYTEEKLCQACDESCQNCTGPGPKACGECKGGWTYSKEAGCQDVNECENEGGDKLCPEGQQCTNAPGSYACACLPGYIKDSSGACVQQHKDESASAQKGQEGDADAGKKDPLKSSGDNTDQSSKENKDSTKKSGGQTAKDSPKENKDSTKKSGGQTAKDSPKENKDSTKKSGDQTEDSQQKAKAPTKGSGNSTEESKQEL
ncbi:uncharacterized protein LOC143285214 [Babylonia areolata]|uniref:uncharacterized protein LOC143285214 n=1 Tax=Babylonia areolata TaxID=304850 RepID=UPI003FD1EB95